MELDPIFGNVIVAGGNSDTITSMTVSGFASDK
ncbi:MAG: hypothetical protein HW380_260 [Magnetococcales bacterium]|nr:hypothetical protein [Magnetococcales bacterium]